MTADHTQNNVLYQHHRYLLAYALRRTGDKEMAKDLIQETYLAALEQQGRFGQRSSIRTWLVAILKNKTCDAYRKKAIEREKVGVWKEEPVQEMFNFNYELLPVIKKSLTKLPPLWQSVFTMKDLEERPASEICSTLKLTPANYWLICHRARCSLRKGLRDFI